ncbi:MAG TPA: LysM peptidoglycan-binding domain-containing protein [Actinomycetota bacterium]|nr:LysM peptidoglycan-binding domain-containing protein [Actinomycetota bacterium]
MTRTRVRWGRVGATAAAAAVGIGLFAGSAGAGSRAADPAPAPQHVVRSGETVWSIAQHVVGPEEDPRPVVDTIIKVNRIENGMIVPGQVLALPRTDESGG